MSKKNRCLLMGLPVFALILVLSACSVAFAAEERIGGLNPNAVVLQHPKIEQINGQLSEMRRQKEVEIQGALSREADEARRNELRNEMSRRAVQELAEEEARLMQPIFTEIDMAIRTVAVARGLTVVIDSTAVFYGGMDITNDVVQELRRLNAGG